LRDLHVFGICSGAGAAVDTETFHKDFSESASQLVNILAELLKC
jgi:hypothetical protein